MGILEILKKDKIDIYTEHIIQKESRFCYRLVTYNSESYHNKHTYFTPNLIYSLKNKLIETTMYKTQRNLITVSALFIGLLILSNVLASKVVQIGFIEIPAAVIAYPITFLCIDIISEIWGKKEAQFVVILGFILQICAMAISYIAIFLPPAPYTDQASFANTIGSQFGIVLASLSAYICSQSFDIFAFHKVKKHFSPKWMRNNTTIVSQLIDTVIFITIAGLLVWHIPLETILVMIGSQYIVKVLFAIIDTPFFYYFTRHGNAEKPTISN